MIEIWIPFREMKGLEICGKTTWEILTIIKIKTVSNIKVVYVLYRYVSCDIIYIILDLANISRFRCNFQFLHLSLIRYIYFIAEIFEQCQCIKLYNHAASLSLLISARSSIFIYGWFEIHIVTHYDFMELQQRLSVSQSTNRVPLSWDRSAVLEIGVAFCSDFPR